MDVSVAARSTGLDGGGERHHAVIVFADVVGYSRLMADDEPGTLNRWTALYKNVLKPEAERGRGQVGDLRGDGILLEFEQVADALAWSRLAHRAATATGIGDTAPLALRVAIHQGTVFSTREGLFGDAVNIAARLQQHAAPGGTVISESVKEALGGGPGEPLLDLGRLRFKNDSRSFRAFALGGGHVPPRPRAIETLPSIAVLPLVNLAGDEADAYLAAGVVDDVIQSLGGLSELAVISRGSTIGYSGPAADPVMAGRELGARYVLTGSLSRAGDAVRITTKLTDVETGRQMWAGRREGKGAEVFDLQDRITQQIVTGVAPNIRASELQAALRKRPESLTAYDRMLRGVHLLYSGDRATSERARQHLEEAMLEDPTFALPAAYASWWHCLAVGQGWSADPEADTERAFELASRAIALEPSNALALSAKGHLLSYLRREYDAALLFFARALEACPNHAFSWMLSSTTLSFIGRAEEALARAQHALLLSPQDQSRYLYLGRVAIAHFAAGNMPEAVRWARLCRDENPGYTANLRYLTAALARLGSLAEARAIAGDLMGLEPEFRLATFARRRQPFRQPETGAAYLEGLRAAGLPD
jgi:adenylate cyclase